MPLIRLDLLTSSDVQGRFEALLLPSESLMAASPAVAVA